MDGASFSAALARDGIVHYSMLPHILVLTTAKRTYSNDIWAGWKHLVGRSNGAENSQDLIPHEFKEN